MINVLNKVSIVTGSYHQSSSTLYALCSCISVHLANRRPRSSWSDILAVCDRMNKNTQRTEHDCILRVEQLSGSH